MNKARKILGEMRRKACGAHGVGRWKDSEGCFVEPSTLRCPSDGQTGEHQDRPTSSTGVASSPGSSSVFSAWLIFFISLHTQQVLQIQRGRADWKHKSSFTAKQRDVGRTHLLWEMKQSVASAISPKRFREHWQSGEAGDTWDMKCQGTAGTAREPKREQRMKPSTFHLLKTPSLWFHFFSTSAPLCDSSLT